MAANAMHGDTRRNFAVTGMEGDTFAIDVAHHQRDVLDRERMAQHAVAHAAAGRIAHLLVLQMEARIGEAVEIAGVVVMQMGDDDVLDALGGDAEASQHVDRVVRQLAAAQPGLFRVESRVDQDVAAVAADQPDEIIEVLRGCFMGIGQEKVQMRRAGRHGRVAERVDFVGVSHGRHFFLSGLLFGHRSGLHQAIAIGKRQTQGKVEDKWRTTRGRAQGLSRG